MDRDKSYRFYDSVVFSVLPWLGLSEEFNFEIFEKKIFESWKRQI